MFKVEVIGGRVPFNREFKLQLNAEVFIYQLADINDYSVIPHFEKKFTEDEVRVEIARQQKLLKEANRLQSQARDRTSRNFGNPNWDPCEVCGKKHETYKCCEKCNYDTHTCHFCGDHLGHSEVSVCYILEGLGE